MYRPSAGGVQHSEKPPRLFAAKPAPLITLDALPPAQVESDVAGTVRALPSIQSVTGIATFRSAGAARVRLHLRDVNLPNGGVMWVAGSDGIAIAFGAELLAAEDTLWTPSVTGDTISIQLSTGSTASADSIGHMYSIANSTTCFRSAACASFPDKTALSAAVGQMTFQRGTSFVRCTGGLIVDEPQTTNAYFLTANHCISTQAEASSLDLAWDAVESSCGANDVASRVKRTTGSTLVTTSVTTDVTLLRLTSTPPGRWLLGWDANPPSTGTVLRRISHPAADDGSIYSQVYTASSVYGGSATCVAAARPQFLYSTPLDGGAGPGSSGSPVIIDGGYIVGQLNSGCGSNPNDACSTDIKHIDGAFAACSDRSARRSTFRCSTSHPSASRRS